MSFKLGNIIRLTSLTNKTQWHIFRPITVHLVTDAAVTLKYLPWNRLSCELKQLCDNENSVCNRTRKHNTNQLDSQTTFVVSVVENENFTYLLSEIILIF